MPGFLVFPSDLVVPVPVVHVVLLVAEEVVVVVRLVHDLKREKHSVTFHYLLQRSAKEWVLGCVNSRPAARGSQEAVSKQPWAHFIPDP